MSLDLCIALWVFGVLLLMVGIFSGYGLGDRQHRVGLVLSVAGLVLMCTGIALTFLTRGGRVMAGRLSPTERIAAFLVKAGLSAHEAVGLLAAHDAQVKAEAWDEGAKYGTYRTNRGEAVIYDIDNPHRTQTKEKRPRTRDILLAPSDPGQDAADLAAAAEPPEPYPGKPYPADVERLAEVAALFAEAVKGERDNGTVRVPIADLRVAAEVMAAAASGRLLPDPKAGCSCIEGTLEDYGQGITQWFPEYDAACPQHSGNLYDPRTGVWILRPEEQS